MYKTIAVTAQKLKRRHESSLSINYCSAKVMYDKHIQRDFVRECEDKTDIPFQIGDLESSVKLRNEDHIDIGEDLKVKTSIMFIKRSFFLLAESFIRNKKSWSERAQALVTEFNIPHITRDDIKNKLSDEEIPEESLLPTEYCSFAQKHLNEHGTIYYKIDTEEKRHQADTVTDLARFLFSTFKPKTTQEKIVILFEYVRELDYRLGFFSQKSAYDTLREGYGTCSNKSLALMALLRSQNIPALPVIYKVNAPEYLGNGLTIDPRLSFWVGKVSLHVSLAVHNGNKWIYIDPSDNTALSTGSGDVVTLLPVSTDGNTDAILYLDPKNILDISVEMSMDKYIKKGMPTNPKSVHVNRLILALYVDYLIHQQAQSEKEIAPQDQEEKYQHFLKWLTSPNENGSFIRPEKRIEAWDKYVRYFTQNINSNIKSQKNFKRIHKKSVSISTEYSEFQMEKINQFFNEMRDHIGKVSLSPEKYFLNPIKSKL